MSPGRRESDWLVIRRCLTIIRRVQRGPATREDLLQTVRKQEGPEAYGTAEDEAAGRRLEKDLQRIRDNLGVDLYYDRQARSYAIRDTWLPLLDLPDDDLTAIAWLETAFGPESPQHDEIHALLGRLRLYLGLERLADLERCRTTLAMDLSRRDDDALAPAVWEGLNRALLDHHQVEFLYLSPRYEDKRPRRHVADPQKLTFDARRGHYYLVAYCRSIQNPAGRDEPCRYITYRVGRIVELAVLPQKLGPLPPVAPRYAVEYELAPEIARLGSVSRQPEIEIVAVERRADGSALVRGQTGDLFFAVRALLHYGPTCRVLGGPEMLREMRETVRKMAEVYPSPR